MFKENSFAATIKQKNPDHFDSEVNEIESKEEIGIKRLRDLLRRGASKGTIASCLSFCDGPESWELRQEIDALAEREGREKRLAIKNDLVSGLAGLDSSQAWQWRDKAEQEEVDLNALLLSLRGLDSADAWDLRARIKAELSGKNDKYRNSPTLVKNLFLSLIGLDSEEAWRWREDLLGSGGSFQDYVLSLSGVESVQAQNKKEKILNELPLYSGRNLFNSLALSSIGQNNFVSERIRREFIKGHGDRNVLLDSLALDDSDSANKIRQKQQEGFNSSLMAAENKELALHLGLSIAGLETPQAQKIRRDLLNRGHLDAVAYSLHGDIYSSYSVALKNNYN
jgi:hypothetical protein